jgi:hypothetical protein
MVQRGRAQAGPVTRGRLCCLEYWLKSSGKETMLMSAVDQPMFWIDQREWQLRDKESQ